MSNKKKVMLMAFLYQAFIGLCGGALGIIILPVAEEFGITPDQVAATFSVFRLGSTIFTISTTSIILTLLSIRKTVVAGAILLIAGAATIFAANSITAFYIAMLFFGFGVGLSFAMGQYLILSTFEGKERNAKISLLNFFYSAGGVIWPIAGAFIMSKAGVSWKFVFTGPAILILVNAVLCLGTDFSYLKPEKKVKQEKQKTGFMGEIRKWPVTVWLVGLAAFMYTMSEITLTTWLVPYAQEGAGVDAVVAAGMFSTFWLFVGVGRALWAVALKKVPAEYFLVGGACFTALMVFTFRMLGSSVAGLIWIMMAGLGFGFSALQSVLNSYGTLQVKVASRAIVTLFLGIGSLGPVVAPIISSNIQKVLGYDGVVLSSAIWMVGVSVLILSAVLYNKARGYKPYETAEQEVDS